MALIKTPLLFLSACLAVSAGIAYVVVTRKSKLTPAPTIIVSPTPTASPSVAPTPKPLTFAEMNALYGPCASLPVLMYHHVQEDETAKQNGNGSLTVSPANFEKQLAYLNDRKYISIGPTDLIAFFNQGQSLPKKAVLLTFDDAYADFAAFAVPLLSRYGVKATLFVPTGLIENSGYLSWSTINSINHGAVYFGNHTWSHKNMGASLETIKKEITTAGTQLAEHGLDQLKVFAYPYGITNPQAIDFLRDSGFQLAFTTAPGRTLCAKQRLSLPRLRVGNVPSLASYGL